MYLILGILDALLNLFLMSSFLFAPIFSGIGIAKDKKELIFLGIGLSLPICIFYFGLFALPLPILYLISAVMNYKNKKSAWFFLSLAIFYTLIVLVATISMMLTGYYMAT